MGNPANNTSEGGGPIGSGDYEIQQGDCISSIAHRSGHFWRTLWNHPGNAQLKQARRDPNVLLPGDRVTIPVIEIKQEARPTDKRHTFLRKGEPARLRIRLMIEDDDESADSEPAEPGSSGGNQPAPRPARPRVNQPYVLDIDGTLLEGRTDGDGMLDVPIPCDASRGKLTIGPDNMVIDLALGAVNPVSELSGIQGRLNNLGYNCGSPDGTLNNATRGALKLFQQQNGLDTSGKLDDATRQKIEQIHGI